MNGFRLNQDEEKQGIEHTINKSVLSLKINGTKFIENDELFTGKVFFFFIIDFYLVLLIKLFSILIWYITV